jgi:hypothetical protein
MDDPNTTTGTHEADEDILSYTVSDDALEAAADIERVTQSIIIQCKSFVVCDA